MSNDYYTPSGAPGSNATLSSAQIRAELALVAAGFDMLPDPDQINSGATNSATTTGSANAYLASIASVTAYEDKQRYTLKINVTNTGASTLNVSGIGTRTIKRLDGSGLEAGDLMVNRIYDFAYNATDGTVSLMTLMPDTVQSSTPTFVSVAADEVEAEEVTADIVKLGIVPVSISTGNVTLDLSAGTVFILASMASNATVTLINFDPTKACTFSLIVTTTGAYNFTTITMAGITIYSAENMLTAGGLKANGRSVVGFLFTGTTLDVITAFMNLVP